jgi:hypothetical protein
MSYPTPQITRPFLTKFEAVKLIALRRAQLSKDMRQERDTEKQAIEELLNGSLDYVLRRILPCERVEEVHVRSLTIPSDLIQDLTSELRVRGGRA